MIPDEIVKLLEFAHSTNLSDTTGTNAEKPNSAPETGVFLLSGCWKLFQRYFSK